MKEDIVVLLIVFATPVAIISIFLAYKLLNNLIQRGRPVYPPPEDANLGRKGRRHHEPNLGESIEDLRVRAAQMQKRIETLEDILTKDFSSENEYATERI